MSKLPESHPKESAPDGKGAVAGTPEALPEQTTVESVADAEGLGHRPGEAIHLKEKLDERDDRRWELDADSAAQ